MCQQIGGTMRITNKMMTSNMLNNINHNKLLLSKLENQYSTGKRIQKPSEDPIIAVRALKLRTNVSQLNQFYEKNIPDAQSWMEVTESALTKSTDILTKLNALCVQGSTDSLTADDRTSILNNLVQLKEQILQEGNSDYAGRYVFTGYKTDTPLIFKDSSSEMKYEIEENFTGEKIDIVNTVVGGYGVNDDIMNGITDISTASKLNQCYRLQLSYDNLDVQTTKVPLPGGGEEVKLTSSLENISYTSVDATGAEVTNTLPVAPDTVITKKSSQADAYTPGDDEIYFLADTGELVMGKNVYEKMKYATNIEVNYEKTDFKKDELRPEHYFNCTTTDLANDNKKTTYTQSNQSIEYEINFNQMLSINVQAKDAITHDIDRIVDDVQNSVNNVTAIEKKMLEVNRMLEDTTLTSDQRSNLNKLNEQFKTELALSKSVMQETFSRAISATQGVQDTVNEAIADLGARSKRLELTKDRLSDQQVEFQELMSLNEDVDLVNTVIKYSSAEAIYNASLNAASKVVQNNLLNFL